MTKHENHLFCRIAVHNKLVSVEEANACLREALGARRNVGDVFIEKGLLTPAQVQKVRHAVARVTPPAQGPAPAATHRHGEPGGRKKGHPVRQPMSQAQLGISVASLVVFLVVIALIVYLVNRGSGAHEGETPTKAPKRPVDFSQTTAPLGPGDSAPKSKTPGAPATSRPLSQEDRREIDDACNQALTDANSSMMGETYGPAGIASLDGFMKNYGERALPEHKDKIKEKRDRLVDLIKKKWEQDKKRLLEAKQKNDAAAMQSVSGDVRVYADDETLKELEGLMAK